MKYLLSILPLICFSQNLSLIQLERAMKTETAIDSLTEIKLKNNVFIIDCLYVRPDNTLYVACNRCLVEYNKDSSFVIYPDTTR